MSLPDMIAPTLNEFLATSPKALQKGPLAVLFLEDDCELESTLTHHLKLGFKAILALTPQRFSLPEPLDPRINRILFRETGAQAVANAINQIIKKTAANTWLYYGFNAEYLFYPFCETRSIGEFLSFVTEERRASVQTYVIDLYASDLSNCPEAVNLKDAQLDRSGYYALARHDANGQGLERQMDFFGGLRWRFEEHIPPTSHRIDRVGLFRTTNTLTLLPDHRFNIEEYNTYACPWHHSPTASILSFRTAKALRRNPGSRNKITSFQWHNSVAFEWHSRQLLDLGLMEPGQWF